MKKCQKINVYYKNVTFSITLPTHTHSALQHVTTEHHHTHTASQHHQTLTQHHSITTHTAPLATHIKPANISVLLLYCTLISGLHSCPWLHSTLPWREMAVTRRECGENCS